MPIYANFITGGVNNHTTTSEEANSLATDFVGTGVVGTTTNTSGIAPMTGGYAVNAQGTPNMTVAVSPGVAYVTATPSGQSSQRVRIYSTGTETVTINANSSGSVRYDWIYIAVSAANAAAPNLAGDNVGSLVASRSTSLTSDNGTPPTFGTLIAVVTVANGATSITNGNIRDARNQSVITATSANETGWISSRNGVTLPVPSTVTYNGNRSYSFGYTGGDLTTYLSNGMRIRTTRTVAAPTQCTSLNGTTQYYQKTTPTGMAQTDDITVMAWVKVSSYQVGAIVSKRTAGTNGWDFLMLSDGTFRIHGVLDATNYRLYKTYQSLPLNKWVHVAATMDMSGNLATFYIDGISVPYTTAHLGTATALTNATTLNIGSDYASQPFSGKIAQVGIFSAVLSATTIRSYYSQGLSGTETNLVSAYSFNGNANDLNTTNANNLTAQASATATNADSPFAEDASGTPTGTTDFGIVTNVATTTLTVQVPEGCTIPTSGGVSAMSYSTQKAPYGMPVSGERWEIQISYAAYLFTPVNATWYNLNSQCIDVPIGDWEVGWQAGAVRGAITSTVSTYISGICTLSVTSAANGTVDEQRKWQINFAIDGYATGGSTMTVSAPANRSAKVVLSSLTRYYLNYYITTGGTIFSASAQNGITTGCILRAMPAGL